MKRRRRRKKEKKKGRRRKRRPLRVARARNVPNGKGGELYYSVTLVLTSQSRDRVTKNQVAC